MTPRFAVALALAGPLAIGGCSRPPSAPLAPKVSSDTRDEPASCQVASDPLNPLVVEWPGTQKVALEAATNRGIVVVSYVGCVMKVLTHCEAGGAYALSPVTPTRETLAIGSESELFARLPLGVGSLRAELSRSSRLELEYAAVGHREARVPPKSLSGDCRGATHWVRSVTVGAYSLNAYAGAEVSGGASVAVFEARGGHAARVRRLRGQGDVEACGRGAEAATCGAILMLGLAPLSVAGGAGGVAAAGFGDGLGALPPKAADVPPLRLPAGKAASGRLADVDVDYLERVQAARNVDADEDASVEERAAAWQALAAREGALREVAENRARAWRERAAAEARRKQPVAKACAIYRADWDKLQELLVLDEDVVSAAQKAAFRRELKEVYAPWQKELVTCAGPPIDGMLVVQKRTRQLAGGRSYTLPAFWMDVTEVTVAAFEACVRAGKCSPPTDRAEPEAKQCNSGRPDRREHPVNCVSWRDAHTFCAWRDKRLPTSEEWEHAARAADGAYPWADPKGSWIDACWGTERSDGGTCAVGAPKNDAGPFGIRDMAGNVCEWVADRGVSRETCHGPDWYSTESMRNYGSLYNPRKRADQVGFRCARSAE